MSNKQDNSSMCFVCGRDNSIGMKASFREEDDRVICEYTARPEHQSYPGTMHGGLVCTLLDEVMGRTAFLRGLWVVTAKMQVTFRKPVPLEEPFTIVGEIRKLRGRTMEAHAELILSDGSIAAEADSICIKIPNEKVQEMLQQVRMYPAE